MTSRAHHTPHAAPDDSTNLTPGASSDSGANKPADSGADMRSNEQRHKDAAAEAEKRTSGRIYRYAADLLEQTQERDRDVIEKDVAICTDNMVQGALLKAIIAHLDGGIPEPYVPADRTYSDAFHAANKEADDRRAREAQEAREPAAATA